MALLGRCRYYNLAITGSKLSKFEQTGKTKQIVILTHFRKEASERSDAQNWAKQTLIDSIPYYFESIEGCNQNQDNVVTHLMERARVNLNESGNSSKKEVLEQIIYLEGIDALDRKIQFARLFNLPLTYVLYCLEKEMVYLLEIPSVRKIYVKDTFCNFHSFANWISRHKGWKSGKRFRERKDLPVFDQQLRQYHTPWPTNIDCFFTDLEHRPIGIIEFQNAGKTGVLNHSNNDHFQCKLARTSPNTNPPKITYSDDIRRWTSQEILRVQSGLRLFIITWAANESNLTIKEVDRITIPHFQGTNGRFSWKLMNAYKHDLHKYVCKGRPISQEQRIAKTYHTFHLTHQQDKMLQLIHHPTLRYTDKTFPAIYYRTSKKTNQPYGFPTLFEQMINDTI